MEPTSDKSDIILGITPKSMVEGRGPQRLVFIVIAILGFVLICLGAYILYASNHSWVPEVCLALGVAIAAPAILSYMYRRYLLENIKEEIAKPAQEFKEKAFEKINEVLGEVVINYRREIVLLQSTHEAGLFGVYSSRREAIGVFIQFLEEEDLNIMVVGTSSISLLKSSLKEYETVRSLLLRKKQAGVRIRFLLTHPAVADLRTQPDIRLPKDAGNEILKSLKILLEEWKVPRKDIKLYLGTPTCVGWRTEKAMLLNFYLYKGQGFASPSLIVRKGGFFYDNFNNNHFLAWPTSMALSVPNDLNQLEEKLGTFATKIQELMELAKVPMEANN